jgi:hypothetical protein
MNRTLSAPDYAEIYGFFFNWIPRNTTLDMGKICSMHENYVYGQLSKTELTKIIEANERKVEND